MNFIKIMGALICVGTMTALGIKKAEDIKYRARLPRALSASFCLMRGEIVTRLSSLPDTIERLAKSAPMEVRGFYVLLFTKLDELGEREFFDIWCDCVSYLALNERDMSVVCDLASILGKYEAYEQGLALNRCIEHLNHSASSSDVKASEASKLYTGLGMSLGLIISILLY